MHERVFCGGLQPPQTSLEGCVTRTPPSWHLSPILSVVTKWTIHDTEAPRATTRPRVSEQNVRTAVAVGANRELDPGRI